MSCVEYLTEEDVDAVRAVAYACSTDKERPQLNMVQLCDGWAMATDSYRLAAAELPDFVVSSMPKFVVLAALPAHGGCRIEYEFFDKGDKKLTRTVKIAGEAWDVRPETYLNWWGLCTGALCGKLTLGPEGRAALVEWIEHQRRAKKVKRDDPVALSRGVDGIKVEARKVSTMIEDPVPLSSEWFSPRLPVAFNSLYLTELLRFAPYGEVEMQFHTTKYKNCYAYATGPVVIHEDDEIHALMPVRVGYSVDWGPPA